MKWFPALDKGMLWRIGYPLTLATLGGIVLVSFVRPSERHGGINSGDRVRLVKMVEGTAARPYVCRTLLPTAVRAASLVVPDEFRLACSTAVKRHWLAGKIFDELEWEPDAAFEFLLAALLMFLCFIGFGHCATRLVQIHCGVPDTGPARLLVAAGALLGLPAFFRYTSYPYDPPQLFLFTLALVFLSDRRAGAFFAAFVACCINKETALFLIPLYGLTFVRRDESPRRHVAAILGLVAVYACIKLIITWVFSHNPGSTMEYHHFGHNLRWLTSGYTFADILVCATAVWAISFRWNEKPAFLRYCFLCVLIPQLILALFFGVMDEFRVFYEVYPLALGLIAHSLLRLGSVLRRTCETYGPEPTS